MAPLASPGYAYASVECRSCNDRRQRSMKNYRDIAKCLPPRKPKVI